MFEWIRRVLSRPRADLVVLAVGTLLILPSIPTGVAADDSVHELAVSGSNAIPGFARHPLDLFHFATGNFTKLLIDDGVLPWWTDPKVHFAFFRPLSSLTHVIDHFVLGDVPALMHLHSVIWATLTVLAVRAVYRTVNGSGFEAALALAFYALDDARGPPISWVANRNAFVACSVSVFAFYLYLRGRAGARGPAVAAPAVFAVALMGGEGAMAITPYLFAHALFVQEGALKARFASLLPFVGVTLAYGFTYRALGYGISGSGLYFDPALEPSDFFRVFPERFTMLWFAQLGGPWSEWWNGYAIMFPGTEVVVAVLAVLFLAFAGVMFAPIVKRDPIARFWLLGAALSTLPACGAFTADRLLPWVSMGAMGLTARFFRYYVEEPPEAGLYRHVARIGAFCAVAAHLVLGPLLLPLRVTGNVQVSDALERAERSVPSDPSIRERVVVYVNPPADPFASYVPVQRAVLGVPRAKNQFWLADGSAEIQLTRVDERTLRVRPAGGFMIFPSERLFRNTRRRPFRPGDVLTIPEAEVTIEEVTDDGRPKVVLTRLHRPLEDAGYAFLAWDGAGYVPFTPPAVGAETTLPAVDLVAALYGKETAVSKWLAKK